MHSYQRAASRDNPTWQDRAAPNLLRMVIRPRHLPAVKVSANMPTNSQDAGPNAAEFGESYAKRKGAATPAERTIATARSLVRQRVSFSSPTSSNNFTTAVSSGPGLETRFKRRQVAVRCTAEPNWTRSTPVNSSADRPSVASVSWPVGSPIFGLPQTPEARAWFGTFEPWAGEEVTPQSAFQRWELTWHGHVQTDCRRGEIARKWQCEPGALPAFDLYQRDASCHSATTCV